jgi:hypothetical protein
LALVAGLAALLILGAPAFGAECIGVTAPDRLKDGTADLVLNGMGIRKATMLKVKVYVASLYLPEKSNDAAHILGADRPWQLVLSFVHDVDASDMHDAFEEGFKKVAGSKLTALNGRIETLKAAMVDFENGHALTFTNDPVKGVAVDVNGAGGPDIHGADFSAALLSIWIGAEPPNEDLKVGLLGGRCE